MDIVVHTRGGNDTTLWRRRLVKKGNLIVEIIWYLDNVETGEANLTSSIQVRCQKMWAAYSNYEKSAFESSLSERLTCFIAVPNGLYGCQNCMELCQYLEGVVGYRRGPWAGVVATWYDGARNKNKWRRRDMRDTCERGTLPRIWWWRGRLKNAEGGKRKKHQQMLEDASGDGVSALEDWEEVESENYASYHSIKVVDRRDGSNYVDDSDEEAWLEEHGRVWEPITSGYSSSPGWDKVAGTFILWRRRRKRWTGWCYLVASDQWDMDE